MDAVPLSFKRSNGKQHLIPSPQTPSEYNGWVKQLSDASIRASLFAGRCKRLAKFLEDAENSVVKEPPSNNFVRVFSSNATDMITNHHLKGRHKDRADSCKRVIFLAGYPSAQVLAEIGATYQTDPDFFDTHLNFISEDHTSCRAHPSFYTLPSRQQAILQLSIQSIGGGELAHEDWHTTRQRFVADIGSYLHSLRMGDKWKTFDSIVRGVEVHDRFRFSLEQFITIQISRDLDEGDHWTVYIWSDAGTDLEESPQGPWDATKHSFHFRPVSLHPLRLASMNKRHKMFPTETLAPSAKKLQHSLPLLRDAYSQIFTEKLDIESPITALDLVLRYFCASEIQYLDMIASVLEASTQSSRHPKDFRKKQSSAETRAILLNSRRILRYRRSRIKDVIEYVRFHGTAGAAVADSEAALSISSLLRDLEHLFLSNGELMLRCEHEVEAITNEAIFEDAQAGIALSKSSHKFAVFVAIYAPVTFTCSVFGMNFVSIGDISWGLELWAMVTIPICIISSLFVFWDSELIQRGVHRVRLWIRASLESTLSGKDEERPT